MVMGYGWLVSFWATHNLELSSQLLHKVLFENVCHLETLVFETVSRLSSSSHLSKGELVPMISPLDTILAARLLGIGINPQRYQASTPLACDLGNLKPLNLGSYKHNPNKLKQRFKTVSQMHFNLESWLLNSKAQEVPWWCCLLNPWFSAQATGSWALHCLCQGTALCA